MILNLSVVNASLSKDDFIQNLISIFFIFKKKIQNKKLFQPLRKNYSLIAELVGFCSNGNFCFLCKFYVWLHARTDFSVFLSMFSRELKSKLE